MTRVMPQGMMLDRLSPARRREAEAFARLLEDVRPPGEHDPLRSLVTVARSLETVGAPRPGADFRVALRDRLVTEAASRRATVPQPRPASDSSPVARPPVGARARQAVATVAIASVVTGGGAAMASTRALPGDLLYGLKRQVEAAQLALAFSDLARGRELLEQADARLGEAERLVAATSSGSTRKDITRVLDDWAVATNAGAEALTRSYRETGDAEPMIVLSRFVTDHEERLEDLLVLLDPSLRDQVRSALDALATLGVRTHAVLAVAASDARPAEAGDHGRASGDGWAVSRVTAWAADSTGGSSAGMTATGGTDGFSTGDALGALGDAAGGVTGDAVGGVTGGAGGSGGSDAPGSTAVLDPVTGGSTPTDVEDSLGDTDPLVGDPLDTDPVLSDPLAPTEPLTDTVTSDTGPLPTVSATPLPTQSADATCVPLPPLTSC